MSCCTRAGPLNKRRRELYICNPECCLKSFGALQDCGRLIWWTVAATDYCQVLNCCNVNETCIGESDEHVLTVTTLQVYRFYKMVAVGILPIWSQLKPNLVAKCTVHSVKHVKLGY